jgi:hypothetical protein
MDVFIGIHNKVDTSDNTIHMKNIIFLLLFCSNGYAQDPDSIWRREYQRQIYKKIDSLRRNGYLKGKIPRERQFYKSN